jgi:hypothetical protein
MQSPSPAQVKQLAIRASVSATASLSPTRTPRIAAPQTNEMIATRKPIRTVGTARPA